MLRLPKARKLRWQQTRSLDHRGMQCAIHKVGDPPFAHLKMAARLYLEKRAKTLSVMHCTGESVITSLVELPEGTRVQRTDVLSPHVFAITSEDGEVSWVVNSEDENAHPGPGSVYSLYPVQRTLRDKAFDSLEGRMRLPGLYEHERAHYQKLTDAAEGGTNKILTSVREGDALQGSSALSIAVTHERGDEGQEVKGMFVVREDLASTIEVVHPDESKSRCIDVKNIGFDPWKWIDASQLANGEVCTLQVCDEEPREPLSMWQIDETSLRKSVGSWRQMGWRKDSKDTNVRR